MRKVLFAGLLLLSLSCFASTINWNIYTSSGEGLALSGKTFASVRDGQQITFTAEGEGYFSNGLAFEWWPPCTTYKGRNICDDYPREMRLIRKGKTFNKIYLMDAGSRRKPALLQDSRGLVYRQVK